MNKKQKKGLRVRGPSGRQSPSTARAHAKQGGRCALQPRRKAWRAIWQTRHSKSQSKARLHGARPVHRTGRQGHNTAWLFALRLPGAGRASVCLRRRPPGRLRRPGPQPGKPALGKAKAWPPFSVACAKPRMQPCMGKAGRRKPCGGAGAKALPALAAGHATSFFTARAQTSWNLPVQSAL